MYKIILSCFLLLFTSTIVAQKLDDNFRQKILKFYNNRNYKACVDEGVAYLERNGNDSLQIYINRAKTKLLNYNSESFPQINEYIKNAIRLAPKIIPEYAIYAGLAKVTFWMMYDESFSREDQYKILNFSLQLFKKSFELTPKDSLKVISSNYSNAAEIFQYYGDVKSAKNAIKLAYQYNPLDYHIAVKVASYYEQEGNMDSCEIVLTNLYNYLPSNKKNDQNIYEFIGDHLQKGELQIYYYNKAIDQGARDASVIYEKIAKIYYYDNKNKAIEYYKKVLELNPQRNDIYIDLGFLSHLNRDDESAIKYYSKVNDWSNSSSFSTDLHMGIIGDYYFDRGEYKYALKYVKKSNDYSRIGKCYYALGEYKLAIDNFSLEIEKTQNMKWFDDEYKNQRLGYLYSFIGSCYIYLNDRNGAFSAFQKSYSYDPTDLGVKQNVTLYRILNDNLDWEPIATSKNILHLYNKQRIEKKGNNIKTWIKSVLYPIDNELTSIRNSYIQEMGYSQNKYATYSYSMMYYEFDCSNYKMRTYEDIDYSETGSVINRLSIEKPEWNNVVPESVGEVFLESLCK